jgi:hypothetical protein
MGSIERSQAAITQAATKGVAKMRRLVSGLPTIRKAGESAQIFEEITNHQA